MLASNLRHVRTMANNDLFITILIKHNDMKPSYSIITGIKTKHFFSFFVVNFDYALNKKHTVAFIRQFLFLVYKIL